MKLGDGEVHGQVRTLSRRGVETVLGNLVSQGHVRMEGEAERTGQGPSAVAHPHLKTVALLGAAAQPEVDHGADGPESADLVEPHLEGARPGGHVAQVAHDLVEGVEVDGRGRQQRDVGRHDLGQRIPGGLPHRTDLGCVMGGQGDGHTDDALVRAWCGDLHDSWAPTG